MSEQKLTKKNALKRKQDLYKSYLKLTVLKGLSSEKACIQLAKDFSYQNYRSVQNAINTYKKTLSQ